MSTLQCSRRTLQRGTVRFNAERAHDSIMSKYAFSAGALNDLSQRSQGTWREGGRRERGREGRMEGPREGTRETVRAGSRALFRAAGPFRIYGCHCQGGSCGVQDTSRCGGADCDTLAPKTAPVIEKSLARDAAVKALGTASPSDGPSGSFGGPTASVLDGPGALFCEAKDGQGKVGNRVGRGAGAPGARGAEKERPRRGRGAEQNSRGR